MLIAFYRLFLQERIEFAFNGYPGWGAVAGKDKGIIIQGQKLLFNGRNKSILCVLGVFAHRTCCQGIAGKEELIQPKAQ